MRGLLVVLLLLACTEGAPNPSQEQLTSASTCADGFQTDDDQGHEMISKECISDNGVFIKISERTALQKIIDDVDRASEAGDFKKALKILNDAISRDKDNFTLYQYRGALYLFHGYHSEALADSEKMISIEPNDLHALTFKIHINYAQKKYEDVITTIDQLLKLDPDDIRTLYFRAEMNTNLERYEEVVADFDRAIAIDPDIGLSYNYRSVAYRKLGQLDKAKADCKKAKSLNARPLTCSDR